MTTNTTTTKTFSPIEAMKLRRELIQRFRDGDPKQAAIVRVVRCIEHQMGLAPFPFMQVAREIVR